VSEEAQGQDVLTEVEDGVLVITINRPDAIAPTHVAFSAYSFDPAV